MDELYGLVRWVIYKKEETDRKIILASLELAENSFPLHKVNTIDDLL